MAVASASFGLTFHATDEGFIGLDDLALAAHGIVASRRALPRGCDGRGTKRFSRCSQEYGAVGWLLMPFLLDDIRKIACSQWRMGMWLASKMVPIFTVKGLRHA